MSSCRRLFPPLHLRVSSFKVFVFVRLRALFEKRKQLVNWWSLQQIHAVPNMEDLTNAVVRVAKQLSSWCLVTFILNAPRQLPTKNCVRIFRVLLVELIMEKKPLKKIFFFYCLSKSAGWRIGKIIKKQSKSYFNCARLGANLARPPPLNMGANGYSVSLLDSQTIVIETRPKNAQLVLTARAFVPRRAALCTKDVEHSRADNTSCAAAERQKKLLN